MPHRHISNPPTLTDTDMLRGELARLRRAGQSIGLVPTMGALHEGHLSLVRASNAHGDATVVSIFVNPTQFAPSEDLQRYPRDLQGDLDLLSTTGAELVFAPAVEEMYPPGFSTFVDPPLVARPLEGQFRPTHFRGVATVVLKLLNLVQPDTAYFGQKDFQQAAVVRRMVADLQLPVSIVVCPTVRDEDGVALSSRNRYLTDEQRQVARSLYQCLLRTEQQIVSGQQNASRLMDQMRTWLTDAGVDQIDYAVLVDPHTLQIVEPAEPPVVALLACWVGKTRLIDNAVIE